MMHDDASYVVRCMLMQDGVHLCGMPRCCVRWRFVVCDGVHI